MSRPRLTDEEREARKRERSRRSFSDASYAHYDPRLPRGNRREWESVAETLTAGLSGASTVDPSLAARYRRELQLLGLSDMPTVEGLRSAFRRAAMATHPDLGGTSAAFIAVQSAFERLVHLYPRS